MKRFNQYKEPVTCPKCGNDEFVLIKVSTRSNQEGYVCPNCYKTEEQRRQETYELACKMVQQLSK